VVTSRSRSAEPPNPAYGTPQPRYPYDHGYPLPATPPPAAPRRRIGRIVGIVVAVLVVLAGLGVGALVLFGSRGLDPRSVQQEIVRITQTAAGVAPTDVRCPDEITAQAGGTFTCTATVDQQPVTYEVRQDTHPIRAPARRRRPFRHPGAGAARRRRGGTRSGVVLPPPRTGQETPSSGGRGHGTVLSTADRRWCAPRGPGRAAPIGHCSDVRPRGEPGRTSLEGRPPRGEPGRAFWRLPDTVLEEVVGRTSAQFAMR
jgi:Domain of unknown function (DUF4333)